MTGEVLGLLGELEYALRSNPKEKITSEEELVFQNLKATFVDVFLTSSFLSSLVTWKATKMYGLAPRLLYSTIINNAGAAFVGGIWGMRWAERSCLNPILAADGSRMQRELANIMLAKHQEDPFRPSFISKHLCKLFYPEQVFVDSHPDRSFTRWRLRNFYEDSSVALANQKPSSEYVQRGKQINSIRDVRAAVGGVIADPLDCIFGYAEGSEVAKTHDSGVHSRRISRAQRRAERRQRTRDRAQSAGAKSDHTSYQQ